MSEAMHQNHPTPGCNRARTPRRGVLRCEGLSKTYSEGTLYTPVFDGLELDVRRGETVAVLGASGAGKSTLLHLLGGLDTPSAGEVYVTGTMMSALSDAARGALRNRASASSTVHTCCRVHCEGRHVAGAARTGRDRPRGPRPAGSARNCWKGRPGPRCSTNR